MNHFLKIYFFVFLFLFLDHVNAQKNLIDRVVAVVGNNIISQTEIETQYLQYTMQGEGEVKDMTRCKVLEELLFQKLLLAQAQKDSVEVTDTQVEGELDRRMRYYIAQFGSEEKFSDFYGKTVEQFKAELKESVRNLIMAQTMQSKIGNGVNVTPAEVKKYFEAIPKDSLPFINVELEIGQIVKKLPITVEAKKEAKEKLESLRQRVLKGESFSSLAVLYSEDPGSAKNGGKYENIQRGQFVPEFDAISFRLKEDEVSEVFETTYGYHFMQLIERRGEFVDLRHILIAPKTSVEDLQKSKMALDSIYTTLQNNPMPFSDAAAKYSDDEETKNSGGLILNQQSGSTKFDMDELGQLDPSLVFNIDKLKIGEMTKPVIMTTRDAKQAYRIIYLKSRTEPHVANLKDDYQKIQAMALGEKQQTMTQDWIKKKLVGTYVRINDEYKNCQFKNKWIVQ